jgi:hypothetical protein
MTDPLLRMLTDLPQTGPDPARSARVRARCHAALARSRRPRGPRPSGLRPGDALLAGLGAVYLYETFWLALLFFGIV